MVKKVLQKKKGIFIAIEGMDGAGKDTQIEMLKKHLADKDVVYVREPGGTPQSESIRQVILSQKFDAVTEALLFYAARNELLEQVIRPALAAGKTVVANRFELSTFAYQVYGREKKIRPLIADLSKHVVRELKPHYFFFDLPASIAKQRIEARGGESHFDSEKEAFFVRLRAGYKKELKGNRRAVVIDASKDIETVSKSFLAAVNKVI
jgi:dTMP kinase